MDQSNALACSKVKLTQIADKRSAITLWLIVLIEGFVTIAVEILTIRQLLPMVGNSIVVTSLIIGAFLLFLAYGYRRGGLYPSYSPNILRRNFIIAAALLGIGLSTLFIAHYFTFVEKFLPLFWVLVSYLLLITAPLVYVLAQTVPIAIHWHEAQKSHHISGKILHLSTLGSFLGSVFTTLVLLNYCGVAITLFINFSLLLLLVLLLSDKSQHISLIALALFTLFIYRLNIVIEKHLLVKSNSYNSYRIIAPFLYEGRSGKLLVINNSPSSFIDSNYQGFSYLELIKKILFNDLQIKNKNILILGAGGFTLSAEKTANNHFTYVDIDPDIAAVVQKHFNNRINGEFIAADARSFMQKSQRHYDVIIADTYSNKDAIPHYLLTQEYFRAIRTALTANGIAIFNIIANPLLTDAYSKRIDNTLRSVFSSCMALPFTYKEAASNIIYLCQKSAREQDTGLYTDDKNQAGLDNFALP